MEVDDDGSALKPPPFLVCKERFAKAYRHPDLDTKLTKSRCRSEARLLEKCVKMGLSHQVPAVVRVDPPKLFLEYLDGPNLKTFLQQRAKQQLQKRKRHRQEEHEEPHHQQTEKMEEIDSFSSIDFDDLAKRMGQLIGKLHNIDIIHGDLTTSNMMMMTTRVPTNDKDEIMETDDNQPYRLILLDFGLGKSTTSVEEHAVDLYVLERALQSTHPELPTDFMESLLQEYATIRQAKAREVLQRLEEVRRRGRKRECFG
ncbi:o-sialoglycoprotein endopeptidase [Nitzschia inconspicua]|uniref:non-specific serine/threonine protein kinase n=1 Tax=Nitzschia inconspicua TaxID=303405 RepID=A0A9K3M6X4_9STRA|nr:o-sialoglycoprotein endopeptidase [Nitzschia inconspicua]